MMSAADGSSSRYGATALVPCLFLLACLVIGCAQKQQVDTTPIFFPPPPNNPRIQFLTSFSSSRQISEDESAISLVVIGDVERLGTHVIVKPYGIAFHKGKIYVADTAAATVHIIDMVNKTFDELKGNYNIGKLKKPINVALDEDDNLYVTDTFRKEILVYDAAGNFRSTIGKGLSWKPIDIAIYGDNIYVTDFKNHEVKVFDRKSGRLLDSFGRTGAEDPMDNLSMPIGIAVDVDGTIRVTNMTTGRVVHLDRDGHVLDSFGKLGDGFGQFGRPKGITIDSKGRIYVVDAAHQNVQIFNEKGRLLMFFGDPPLPRGALNLPADIAVTSENLDFYQKYAAPGFVLEEVIFVTNQYGNDKIAVYGMGKMKGIKYEAD